MKKIMHRTFWTVFTVLAVASAFILIFHADWLLVPPTVKLNETAAMKPSINKQQVTATPTTNKVNNTPAPKSSSNNNPVSTATPSNPGVITSSQGSTSTPVGDKQPPYSDPNRPYYDQYGNEFAWDGTLIKAACPDSTGTNPKCACPPATADGVYYAQGYDKNTNLPVCRMEYYQACPYADSVAASDPLCEKLQVEQQTAPKVTQ